MLNASQSLPPPKSHQKPRFEMPRGACDSHTHVIPADGWTLVPGANYTPAPAPAAAHLRMLDALGLDRGVVVQPSIFGTDNRAVVEAIARAPERLRGVVVVDPSIADDALRLMRAQGIRGVRFNVMLGGGGGVKALTELAPRLASLGWHAEILVDGHLLPELLPALKPLPCRLVIDHMASLRADVGSMRCRCVHCARWSPSARPGSSSRAPTAWRTTQATRASQNAAARW
jgi:2-pyrone-4,6-dicarboxylate lactonase